MTTIGLLFQAKGRKNIRQIMKKRNVCNLILSNIRVCCMYSQVNNITPIPILSSIVVNCDIGFQLILVVPPIFYTIIL
jgi:hypothetical protein